MFIVTYIQLIVRTELEQNVTKLTMRSLTFHSTFFRKEKLMQLCIVLGAKSHEFEPLYDASGDPDVTYELTTDNVKKMLAIHMRFR